MGKQDINFRDDISGHQHNTTHVIGNASGLRPHWLKSQLTPIQGLHNITTSIYNLEYESTLTTWTFNTNCNSILHSPSKFPQGGSRYLSKSIYCLLIAFLSICCNNKTTLPHISLHLILLFLRCLKEREFKLNRNRERAYSSNRPAQSD